MGLIGTPPCEMQGGVQGSRTPPAFRTLRIIIMLFLTVFCRYQDFQSAHLTDLLPVFFFFVFFFLSLFKAHGNMNEEGPGGGQSERLPAGGQLV